MVKTIEENASNIDEFNYSTLMKVIVHKYNPNLSRES